MTKIGIILGSGIKLKFDHEETEQITISTPYGIAEMTKVLYQKNELFLLPRHGLSHAVPPHRINYRANICAFEQLGIQSILATSAVGSLTKKLPPGTLTLVTDFLNFTHSRSFTFFDEIGIVQHTDFSEPYSFKINQILLESSNELGIELIPSAVYVCTEGPRYETPAEIRMYSRLGGDVVGMTGYPEVVLAHEKGIKYSSLSIVTNWGTGLSKSHLSHQDVLTLVEGHQETIQKLILHSICKF